MSLPDSPQMRQIERSLNFAVTILKVVKVCWPITTLPFARMRQRLFIALLILLISLMANVVCIHAMGSIQ
jgi:hypothetical protein